ncbi:MAG: universal stress protein [Smithella sp.]
MKTEKESKSMRLLVGLDFSDCSRNALRKAVDLAAGKDSEIIAVHVIDSRLARELVHMGLASEREIKKKLFLNAKVKLKDILAEEFSGIDIKPFVCEGMPHMEINRKAEGFNADMIIIGSCGMAGEPEAIFFGGTAEKILRFASRPVLCVPPAKKGGTKPIF